MYSPDVNVDPFDSIPPDPELAQLLETSRRLQEESRLLTEKLAALDYMIAARRQFVDERIEYATFLLEKLPHA